METECDPFMEAIEGKPVCRDCLIDDGLKKFFDGGYTAVQCTDCHYCGALSIPTVCSREVQQLIKEHCLAGKRLAVEELPYSSREGGFLDTTYEPDDLLEKAWGAVGDSFYSELVGALNPGGELHCDADHTLMSPIAQWQFGWGEFTATIKHRTRFLFGQVGNLRPDRNPDEPSPEEFLQHYVPTGLDLLNAVQPLEAGTPVFRCRETDVLEKVEGFPQIGALDPPSCLAPNRFSPVGISMFYAGSTPEIAAKEIRWSGRPGRALHTGKFVTKQQLTILDFTKLDYPRGRFDPQWINQYHIADFFRSFIQDLSAPCEDDSRRHLDYVPTQVLCEYFRYFGATRDGKHETLAGIKYPSSIDGTPCYALFLDHLTGPQHLDLLEVEHTLRPASASVEPQFDAQPKSP